MKKGLPRNLRGNLFGGITAGVIALPLALAFGEASGLGAISGLYGAIIVGLFATIFGGTQTQISGPTGPMTVIVASIVATHPGDFRLIFWTIFLGGLFQILLGISKIGKLINYVPYPVISGFMSGIGMIIIILQTGPLLGLESQGTPVLAFKDFIKSYHNLDVQSVILGVLTILTVFFTPRKISQKIPPALLALVFVSILSIILHFDVKTIGEIPSSFPDFQLGKIPVETLLALIPTAFTLALLGSVDSLLTSLVADSITKTKHDSNKELIGQGIGNLLSGCFGGLPGAGATMRTVVNIKSGGTTRLSGVVHSMLLISVIIFLAPFASKIPIAVLSGILIKVGFDIIDYKFLKLIKYMPKYDLLVMSIVFFITVFYDLILAVGVGIILASLLFAAKVASQMNIDIKDVEHFEQEECQDKIKILHIDGIFFFGSASHIIAKAEELLGVECLIVDCKNIKTMDVSAIFALEDIISRLHDVKAEVILILNNRSLAVNLLKLGLSKFITKKDIAYDYENALKKASERTKSCS